MSNAKFDVTAIGNAIVDVIAQADDALLAEHNLPKGAMNLIDAETAERLYGDHGPGQGSVGRFGRQHHRRRSPRWAGKTAYIGKVADDQLGEVFTHDIRAVGVTYDTPPLTGGLPTARSLIFVTPDAQRTMQTFLGATHAARSRGRRTWSYITGVEGGVPRGLSVGSAARQGGDARRGDQGAEGRRQGVADAVGLVLRRRASATSSWSWPRSTSTSCSPTRARSCRSTRWRTSTTRCSRCAGTARLPR